MKIKLKEFEEVLLDEERSSNTIDAYALFAFLMKEKIIKRLRDIVLIAMTIAAGYLLLCGVSVINLPEYNSSWLPVQISMIAVGGGWMLLFCKANEYEVDWDDEDEEEL